MEDAMASTVTRRARADSGGSGRVHRASVDADGASDAGDDGGALDALWRFEEAHHFLLNAQLAPAHAAFVDDLYAALETSRDALEQQSVRVLAVLHDKDARIQALEEQACVEVGRVETATQVTPRTKHTAAQCDGTSAEKQEIVALRRQVDEQSEQIEVLLDELERLQQLHRLDETKTLAYNREVDSKAIQTDPLELDGGMTTSRGGRGDALATIAELQTQLGDLERCNKDLRAALPTQTRPPSQAQSQTTTPPDEMELNGIETQLQDAIRVMTTSSSCRLNPLVSMHVPGTPSAMTCLDLEHKLHTAELERAVLTDEVLALRAALTKSTASRPFSAALVPVLSGQNAHKTECSQLTCHDTLRRILHQIQVQRNDQSGREAKTLRREIRHALRAHSEEEAAAIVARVAAQWLRWEAAHVEELEALRRAHVEQLETQSTRITSLVDEIHGLSQRNVDLQAELNVLSRQRAAPSPADTQNEKALATDTATAIDHDRRVLLLEQSVALKQEQLDLANRTVRALSSGVGSPALSVRFADQGAELGQEIAQHWSSLPASNAKTQIAELTIELQALKERDCRRFQPANTSQHAVVEYFRLEKECLRLRCRLKDKDDRIQQLELQCEQLGHTARQIQTSRHSQEAWKAAEERVANSERTSEELSQSGLSRRGVIDRCYLRMLEKRNEDLWTEMTKARSRIAFLERSLKQTASIPQSGGQSDAGKSNYVKEIAHQVEAYHRRAQQAFETWQHSSLAFSVGAKQRVQPSTDPPDSLLTSYGVLLGHYETLSLQLRLLQNANTSDPVPHIESSTSVSRNWQLLEKIHVLEDRLLEAQACLSCGDQVVKKLMVEKKNVGTTTASMTTTEEAGTQVSSRDRQRRQVSKGIQVDQGTAVPFQVEESRDQTSYQRLTQHTASPVMPSTTAMANVEQQTPTTSDSRLQEIQRELDAALARVDELAAQKEKLKERLEEARRANRRLVKEEDSLRSQVAEMESSHESLSNELQYLRQSQPAIGSSGSSPDNALAVKEQENRELVRQLCEAKEKCFHVEKSREDAEHRIRMLEETIKDAEAGHVEDRSRHLEEYMAKVNESLASIERDKERLTRENQELHKTLQQIEMAAAMKEAKGTRTSATETDSALELDRLRQLPEHQALETQVVMLHNELENERRACEELRAARDAEQREKARVLDTERTAIDDEKASLRRLIDEITASHESLQHELIELQAASTEAKEEADKRIQFLMACVEECSRLVDATGPNDEIVTARDIYDTLVALSTRVATAVPNPATTTPRRTKHATSTKVSEMKPKSTPLPSAESTVEELGVHVHSQLQAETWRARAAKLESSLRAAQLKNKTFEDMVDHLENQMNALKGEVKDRMTKESTLLTKQGQMKVEIANLKAQNGTLTSRFTEACGELKRSQAVTKGTDGEVARLRSALQRKTELLARQKAKCEDTQKVLDQATKRIAHLEAADKNLAMALQKQKDQALQFQELRQQWTVSRDASCELRARTDKQKEQISELQSRVKALRLDNGQLRDQLRGLRKAMREEAETAFKSHTADTVTAAAAAMGDGQTPANLTPTAAVDMLAAQVKTLKRRVLQKQDVIIAYKTKLSELDAELVLQRTKLFDLSQSYRQFQQSQREKELSMLQGATHLKDELEQSLLAKTEQLDGLRASIFDACEVFVHCDPPSGQGSNSVGSSSESSAASLTWPEDSDDDIGGDADAHLLQELRRYADLSPGDLMDLRITSPKRKKPKQKRGDKQHAVHMAQQRGARVLQALEHALEVAPHDCREEICGVLEFLCAQRRPTARRC